MQRAWPGSGHRKGKQTRSGNYSVALRGQVRMICRVHRGAGRSKGTSIVARGISCHLTLSYGHHMGLDLCWWCNQWPLDGYRGDKLCCQVAGVSLHCTLRRACCKLARGGGRVFAPLNLGWCWYRLCKECLVWLATVHGKAQADQLVSYRHLPGVQDNNTLQSNPIGLAS